MTDSVVNNTAGENRTVESRNEQRSRWTSILSTVAIVAGFALLVTGGAVIAHEYSRQQEIAELQSRRPIDTGGGPPLEFIEPSPAPDIPTASASTATPEPLVTSGEVPLLADTPEKTLTASFGELAPGASGEITRDREPSATLRPDLPPATHISIPAVEIDSDIVTMNPEVVEMEGRNVMTWPVAEYAAGHHGTSADPGEGGNIVLAGHDDYKGEVFRGLHDIEVGHEVVLTTSDREHTYVVEEIFVRRYLDVPLEEQLAIGNWMAPMPEERLTLITCWPYGINDHRVIVVAKPVNPSAG